MKTSCLVLLSSLLQSPELSQSLAFQQSRTRLCGRSSSGGGSRFTTGGSSGGSTTGSSRFTTGGGRHRLRSSSFPLYGTLFGQDDELIKGGGWRDDDVGSRTGNSRTGNSKRKETTTTTTPTRPSLSDSELVQAMTRYERGNTPLHLTISNKEDSSRALKMIQLGHDLTAVNEKGETPLLLAVKTQNIPIIQAMLTSGKYAAYPEKLWEATWINQQDNNGVSPLSEAARLGNEKIVRLLLNTGAFLYTTTNSGSQIIHQACSSGSLELVKLVAPFFDLKTSLDGNGNTALHCASKSGVNEVVRFVLSKGADVNAKNKKSQSPLVMAVKSGSLQIIKSILSHPEYNQNLMTESEKIEMLNDASESSGSRSTGYLEVVGVIVRSGVDVDTRDATHPTILAKAVETNNPDFVRFLISLDADPDIPSFFKQDGLMTPREYANKHGFSKILSVLKPFRTRSTSFNNNNNNNHFQTQGSLAAESVEPYHVNVGPSAAGTITPPDSGVDEPTIGGMDTLSALESPPPPPPKVLSFLKSDPVSSQPPNKYLNKSPFLSKSASASVSPPPLPSHPTAEQQKKDGDGNDDVFMNRPGETATTTTTLGMGEYEAMKRLQDDYEAASFEYNNNNVNNNNNNKGATENHRHENTQSGVKNQNGNGNGNEKEETPKKEETPVFDASLFNSDGEEEVDEFYDKEIETKPYYDKHTVYRNPLNLVQSIQTGNLGLILRSLRDGADLYKVDKETGHSPLSMAVYGGNAPVLKLLLAKDPMIIRRAGNKPALLDHSVQDDKVDVVRILLNHGCSVNGVDANGDTPLHTAVINQSRESLMLLLEYGADSWAVNKKGQSPIQVALDRGLDGVVKVLREHKSKSM